MIAGHTFGFYPAFIFPILFLIARRLRKRQAVKVPTFIPIKSLPASSRQVLRTWLLLPLGWASIILLTVAAARPQQIDINRSEDKGRNLLLTIDVSGSMKTPDFLLQGITVSRLDAVKSVVTDFISARSGDRVGLVVFGESAFLQAPLTRDGAILTQLVGMLKTGMAGDGTAIGEGLALALKRIAESPEGSRAIILLTDGVNTAGAISPDANIPIAKELGVKVHTIGIGAPGSFRWGSLSAILGNQPAAGSDYDEELLKRIATETGGIFFNASTIEGLKEVYAQIDKLESSAAEEEMQKTATDLSFMPTVAGALCALLYFMLSRSVFKSLP
jgi:Ca-activated chloride channel family protein